MTTTTFAGRTRTETYDDRGRLASTRLGALYPVSIGYDSRGRIVTLTQGPGGAGDRVTTFTYDPSSGRLASVTDPANRVVSFDLYDGAGRVKQMTLPGGRGVSFGYDANGNLTALTPPAKPEHDFSYTPVDLEQDYTPPEVVAGEPRTTTHAYNLDQQLDLVSRPDATSVDPEYDPTTGRLSTLTIPQGSYGWSYYPAGTSQQAGQVSGITAPGAESLTYTYEGPLPLSTTWSGPVAGSVARSFDNDFRVVTETVAGTPDVSFGYDGDSLLLSAGDLTITRDATIGLGAGLVTGTSLGTGAGQVTTSETPNAFAELTSESASVAGTPVFQASYGTRDALGRIVDLSETIQGTTTTTHYDYDAAGRLQTVTVNGSTSRSYGYDLNGNRTEVDGVNVGTYDAQDRLQAYGSKSYGYTLSGELASKTDNATSQTTLYTYDPLSNLRSVTLPNGTQIEYVIDGQNRRVGKKVSGVLMQGWLYADPLRIVAELDGSSNVVSRFVYGTRANVPDYIIRNGITYRILSDHLGSPRLVIDTTTGQVMQRTDYDEWGNVTHEVLAPGWAPIPFGFAGGLYDRDTKLVHFGARDYDPEVGRWTSKDPIGFLADSADLFGYGFNDPINLIDRDGRISESARRYAHLGMQIGLPVAGCVCGGVLLGGVPGCIAGAFAGEGAAILFDTYVAADTAREIAAPVCPGTSFLAR